MPRYLVADTETTSLDDDAEVVDLAWVELDANGCEVLASGQTFFCPRGSISPSAAGTHGLTKEFLSDKPSHDEFYEKFPDYFKDVFLIAHNAQFDRKMLRNSWSFAPDQLCTLRAARLFYPDAPGHKLQTLKHYLGLPSSKAGAADLGHGAWSDVCTTIELLECMLEDCGCGFQGLITEVNKPIEYRVMPFGKFKGKELTDLPWKYRQWLLSLPDLEPDLRVCLSKLDC